MDKSYKVACDDGHGLQSKGHTLFEACLIAKSYGSSGIVLSFEDRLVAFYCGHRKMIAPGFQAYPRERAQIVEDFGDVPL